MGDRIGWSGCEWTGNSVTDFKSLPEMARTLVALPLEDIRTASARSCPGRVEHVPGVQGRWVIDRVDFRQTVVLP